jgi:uncharacterized membrane protein
MNMSLLTPVTLLRKAREYAHKLWIRVAIMGLLAFVAVAAAPLIENLVPPRLALSLGGQAADRLLQIIANAMLAVTTFSLTVMVSVYRASSNQWTPRVHRLIIQDRTTQNTLAVFIGAYVYALLAIILREMGVFADQRAFVLFLMTVVVLAAIVIYLVRWVLHLQSFGSLIDVTRQIEKTACDQFNERLNTPCLGANPLTEPVPDGARPVCATQSGYIQQIYPEALNEVAQRHGVTLYMIKAIGHFAFENDPLIMVVDNADAKDSADAKERGGEKDWDALQKNILSCVHLGDLRTYDQDPRFALLVMGEVASKALSPGVNDPGTAIDVISWIGRILSLYKDEVETAQKVKLPHVYVRPLDPVDLIEDGFGALARDGVSTVEVQMRLQSVLTGLMRHPDKGLAAAAKAAALEHLKRARQAIAYDPDWQAVAASATPELREKVTETAPD